MMQNTINNESFWSGFCIRKLTWQLVPWLCCMMDKSYFSSSSQVLDNFPATPAVSQGSVVYLAYW